MVLPAILRRNIHLSHAKQLAQLKLPSERDTRKEEPPSDLLQTITSWIRANPEAIKAAQNSQCTSPAPDSPDWDTIFFALLESTAMYLRQYGEVVKAAAAAREGNLEQAVDHLQKAQEEIDVVASLLDCTFLQLCDFVTRSPDGLPSLSGAFCGLFISNSTDNPFMGVTYKGTSFDAEVATDLLWRPIKPLRPDVVWGALIHEGFYRGLFDTFTSEDYGPQVPFDLMLKTLADAYDSRENAKLHFTGHSLGGAYCTITYGEFLRRQAESAFAKFTFGDMYALGAPRACLQPFADEVNRRTESPSGGKFSFRIVNMQDPVATLPPVSKDQLVDYPFVHPGRAWRTTLDGVEKMIDEPPQMNPQSLGDIVANFPIHDPTGYYASWLATPHS